MRRILKLHPHFSSSSDGVAVNGGYRAHLGLPNSKLLVNLIHNKAITSAIKKPCECDDTINRNKIRSDNIEGKKETIVEVNGNVDIKFIKKTIAKAPKGICQIADV